MGRCMCNLLCKVNGYPGSIGDRYDTLFWCTICDCAIPQEDAIKSNLMFRCPCCHSTLRVGPRNSKNKKLRIDV